MRDILQVIGKGYQRSPSQLFYKGKIVGEVTHIELDDVSFLGPYLRTKYNLLFNGVVIPKLHNYEWKSSGCIYLGSNFLMSENSIIFKDKVVLRSPSLSSSRRFRVHRVIGGKYLYHTRGLVFNDSVVEEYHKKKHKFCVEELGHGYLRTNRFLIYEGRKICSIQKEARYTFLDTKSSNNNKNGRIAHEPYILVSTFLFHAGELVHRFRKREVGSLRIHANGEYIATNETLLYRHAFTPSAGNGGNGPGRGGRYFGCSYYGLPSALLYRGRLVDTPIHTAHAQYATVSECQLLQLRIDSLKNEYGHWTYYLRGRELSGGMSTELDKVFARIARAEYWTPQRHGQFSRMFQKFVVLLLLCNSILARRISEDVIKYAILPFVNEVEVLIAFSLALQEDSATRMDGESIFVHNTPKNCSTTEGEESGDTGFDPEVLRAVMLERSKSGDNYAKKRAKGRKLKSLWREKKIKKMERLQRYL